MQHSMQLFRVERNFYITGFAIFLSFLIRQLISLISQQANLITQSETSMPQKTSGGNNSNDEKVHLQEKVKILETELNKERKEKEEIILQAESLNREYHRLVCVNRRLNRFL